MSDSSPVLPQLHQLLTEQLQDDLLDDSISTVTTEGGVADSTLTGEALDHMISPDQSCDLPPAVDEENESLLSTEDTDFHLAFTDPHSTQPSPHSILPVHQTESSPHSILPVHQTESSPHSILPVHQSESSPHSILPVQQPSSTQPARSVDTIPVPMAG